jgi:hypothetical protein
MMRALLCCVLVACGGVDSAGDDEADSATPPSAFMLQFTGTYQGAQQLELRPDGTFVAGAERGRFHASAARRELPLSIQLRGHQHTWTATIDAYDGKLHVAKAATLQLVRPATSDEELCDSTRGQWTDDDPDPATGLYCICPAPARFIPSLGGCVP